MHAGAVDYLVKGAFDAIELERTMRYALQQKRHEEAIRGINQQLEERVQERTAELARVNASLQAEIAVRQQADEALREADRRKDEFLATLSHELRNPLSSLSSALALLQLEEPHRDATQTQQLHQVMSRQVEQLVRLIDDLLDVSRISQGKLHLKPEPVPLKEVLATAIDVSRPLLDSAQHALDVHWPTDTAVVDGDRVRLAQVVSNLLINAAKYTPSGGRIELNCVCERNEVVLRIRDNGIGIPGEMLPRIFNMFTQVDSSKTRSHGGLGIGLTLVRTLGEMHAGSVTATSDGLGQGSEFTVRLPLSKHTDEQSAATLVAADSQKQVEQLKPEDSLPALKVLIVDDNESAAHLLSRLLTSLKQEVRVTHMAREALELIPKFQPQVVISDISMPGMTGYELAQRIRQQTLSLQPVLIAHTGYGQESDRLEALTAGFDLHLTKPIGLPALRKLLCSLGQRF